MGRDAEAAQLLRQMARLHGTQAPDLETSPQQSVGEAGDKAATERVSAVYLISRPGIALTSAILGLNWLVVDFCYYGLSLHSVNLSGDLFTNFVLSACVELPAVVLGMLGMVLLSLY